MATPTAAVRWVSLPTLPSLRQQELREAIVRVLRLAPKQSNLPKLITHHSLQEPRKHLRILLADDNAINRELTQRILSTRGHTISAVPNGKLAVAALEADSFDLILMDVQMPEMDGLEATAAIRRKEASTGVHLPIIAMTAHAMKGDRERCLTAGMDAYISKPIQAMELLQLVEGFIGDFGPIDISGQQLHTVFDHALALSRVDADETLLADLARLFCDESPKMLSKINDAVMRRDVADLQRAAHSLKGSVATFAAQDAFDATLKLESIARLGEFADLEVAHATVRSEVGRLCLALQELSAKHARTFVAPTVNA